MEVGCVFFPGGSVVNRSPIQWAILPLKNYATFSGRAPRAEFWWFVLFVMILFAGLYFLMLGSLVTAGAGADDPSSTGLLAVIGVSGVVMFLLWLVLLVPSIAVQARRLHDTDRSGWWLGAFYILYAVYIALWFGSVGSLVMSGTDAAGEPPSAFMGIFVAAMIVGFALFIYMIVLLVFYCAPGTPGANRFGPDPYRADVSEVFA